MAELAALKPNDKARPALAAAVLDRMQSGQLSREERMAAAALLTPADYRARHPSAPDAERWTDGQPNSVTARPSLSPNEPMSIRRTATLDNRGIRWDADSVRAELRETMDTMRRMRFPCGEVPSTKVAACIEFARSAEEILAMLAEGADDGRGTVHRPSPRELKALDDTLPWLFAVTDWRQRLCVSLRASDMSWRKVSERLNEEIARRTGGDGISHVTARQWEGKAVDQIVKALNSQPNRGALAA
ncbi:hypothetical protein [Azospirillum sp. sgz302134]